MLTECDGLEFSTMLNGCLKLVANVAVFEKFGITRSELSDPKKQNEATKKGEAPNAKFFKYSVICCLSLIILNNR
jgi:hypothetical protein